MKKIIIIIFLLSSLSIFAGPNPHDSLLFDGALENSGETGPETNPVPDKNCKWKVKFVWGSVIGTRDTTIKITMVCGQLKKEGIGQYQKQVRSPMRIGDEVYDNDKFEMDDQSFIQIEQTWGDDGNLPLHMLIFTMNSKSYRVPSCPYKVVGGYKWEFDHVTDSKFMWESQNSDHQIQTDNAILKPSGTKYSLEMTATDDIIKVYEGSVELIPRKYDTSPAKELTQLNLDYQAGKITMEEFVEKSKEIQARFMDETKKTAKIIIEAGYMVTVGEKLGDITPIPPDDVKWWEKP